MRSVWTATVVALLMVIGSAMLMANGGSEGDGICITISPQTLVLSHDSCSVTVHTNIAIGLVNCDSLQLEGIAPYLTKADNRGELVAKFDADAVKAIVDPGQVTLTLTGLLVDDIHSPFAASDTITVKE
ncbi:hypothetical protein H8E77_22405 [bacterium]|nr:hypothetical protein [bacterium]